MSGSLPLGELLRQYRSEAHLSQEQLAERSDVAARTIGDLETGVSLSPHAITISLISEALELDPECREMLRAASRRGALRAALSEDFQTEYELGAAEGRDVFVAIDSRG